MIFEFEFKSIVIDKLDDLEDVVPVLAREKGTKLAKNKLQASDIQPRKGHI